MSAFGSSTTDRGGPAHFQFCNLLPTLSHRSRENHNHRTVSNSIYATIYQISTREMVWIRQLCDSTFHRYEPACRFFKLTISSSLQSLIRKIGNDDHNYTSFGPQPIGCRFQRLFDIYNQLHRISLGASKSK